VTKPFEDLTRIRNYLDLSSCILIIGMNYFQFLKILSINPCPFGTPTFKKLEDCRRLLLLYVFCVAQMTKVEV